MTAGTGSAGIKLSSEYARPSTDAGLGVRSSAATTSTPVVRRPSPAHRAARHDAPRLSHARPGRARPAHVGPADPGRLGRPRHRVGPHRWREEAAVMVSIAMGAIVVGASFAAAWRVTGLVIRRPSRQLERLRGALTGIPREQG